VIKITNDTTTLNGALSELGETMASNLVTKGVSGATASDGLTTLAGKILNVPSGGGISLTTSILLTSDKVSTEDTATLTCLLSATYDDTSQTDMDLRGVIKNGTITIKDTDNNIIGTCITDSEGIATYTINLSETTTYQASFTGTTTYSSSTSNTVTIEKENWVVPSPYVQVEYLQSTGSQYINTGYILKAEDVVEITLSSQGTGSYEAPFGARKNNSNNNCYALFSRFGGQNKFNYARTGAEVGGNTISTNVIYDVVTNGSQCIVSQNGTVIQTIVNGGTINDCVNPCGLFVLNTDSSTGFKYDTYGRMKIYNFKITDKDGVIKRYCVPVRNGTTGYMYDFITESTMTKNGTFSYGSDI